MDNLDPQEQVEYSFEEVLSKLTEEDDLIFKLPLDEVDSFSKGLAQAKHKQNAELKKNGIPADTRRLQFTNIPVKDSPDVMEVQVRFVAKKGVTILGIRKPEEF